MIEKFSVIIPELSGDMSRLAYIYLPNGYEENDDEYYPVLYMFDGQNLFDDEEASYGKSWGLGNYLDFTDTPLIVAALECNRNPDGERMAEYSPFSDEDPDYGYIDGLGDITMEWFVEVFKPYVDSNYRTIPDREHTFVGGSSMGGHMSLYALMDYNDVFSRAAILSPTLWFGHDDMMEMIEDASIDPYTIAYVDYGTEEFSEYDEAFDQYLSLITVLMEKGVILTSRLIPNGDHSEESWERQIPYFISTLLYDLDDDM